MEPIVILLSSISGALIGTSVGIFLLYHKLRPVTGAELDLTKGKLRTAEFSLASATANLERVSQQLEESAQQVSAAEEKARLAENEIAGLRQQVAEHESKVQDASKAVAESASQQIAAYESRIEADGRRIEELNQQVTHLTAEGEQMKCDFDQESKSRTAIEEQLSVERDGTRSLVSRIAELEAERCHFDLTLEEERQSAAKGIELLTMAQERLTRVFRAVQPAAPVAPAEGNGHELVAAGVDDSPAA
jgi:chromosome segregation ATPase